MYAKKSIKKSIAYISVVHPLHDHRFLYKQCKGLSEQGFDVVYFNAKAESEQTIDGIKIVPLKDAKSRLKRILNTFLLLPKMISLKADAIHLVDPELLPVGIIVKLFTRKIVVFDAHEDYVSFIAQKHYLGQISSKILPVLMKIILVLSAKLFDGFVFSDRPTANLLSMPVSRKCIFFNYPLLKLFPNCPKNWNNRKYDLALVGSMSKTSGTFVLLKAVKILKEKYPGIKVLLIGQPDENIKDNVEQFICINNLEENIEITGRVPHSKVPELLQDCKIGLITLLNLPKFQKNIATKMFEYFASGMPVISADLPPEREYIEEGKTGLFFEPGNHNSLVENVDKLLSDVELGSLMAKQSREYIVTKKIFAENEMKKLAEFYEYLFSHPRRLLG